MKREAFFETINGCLALIEICDPASACSVRYHASAPDGTLHVHLARGHPRVRYHPDTETCHGDFESPILNPDTGARFDPQPDLPLPDAAALRAFLLVHLSPKLALIDVLKHHCGANTSLRCALTPDGAYRFECPPTERALSVDVAMVEKHTPAPLSRMMAHTGARFSTEKDAAEDEGVRPEDMLEHSGFMRPRSTDTLRMSPTLKSLQTAVLRHLMAVDE